MEERIRPTKSGLFAIELLIGVGVFAICAAICVGLFVRAEVVSRDSADMTHAVNEARSVAECYKAAGGDLNRTAELCGGSVTDSILFLEYDEEWNALPGGSEDGTGAPFRLSLAPQGTEGGCRTAELTLRAQEETILSWEIAALEVMP